MIRTKREAGRLAGRWKAHGQTSPAKPLQPGTVNREVDTLKSILSKAVEWGQLVASPARGIKRLKSANTAPPQSADAARPR